MHKPKGLTVSELPMRKSMTQKERKAAHRQANFENAAFGFAALAGDDESDGDELHAGEDILCGCIMSDDGAKEERMPDLKVLDPNDTEDDSGEDDFE